MDTQEVIDRHKRYMMKDTHPENEGARDEREVLAKLERLLELEKREPLVQALLERIQTMAPDARDWWALDLPAIAVRDFALTPSADTSEASPASAGEPCEYDCKCSPGRLCRVHDPACQPAEQKPVDGDVDDSRRWDLETALTYASTIDDGGGSRAEDDECIRVLSAEVRRLRDRDTGWATQVSALHQRGDSDLRRIRELLAERDQLKADLSDVRASEAESMCQMHHELGEILAQRNAAVDERDQLKAELSRTRAERDDALKAQEAAELRIVELRADLDRAHQQIADLTEQMQSMQEAARK